MVSAGGAGTDGSMVLVSGSGREAWICGPDWKAGAGGCLCGVDRGIFNKRLDLLPIWSFLELFYIFF